MKYVFLILGLTLSVCGYTQEKSKAKFGEVSSSDFLARAYPIDSSAGAVIIADIGQYSLAGNSKGWFSLIFKHYRRVHILDKKAFDIANVSLFLYKDGSSEEKLDKLKAVTYNIANGRVTETKLAGKSVFTEKIDKNRVEMKFTFPDVREGSIIEFEYTTVSDYIQSPDAWSFQDVYPTLWSEYSFAVPSFFSYVYLRQGYLKFDIIDQKNSVKGYSVRVNLNSYQSQVVDINAGTTTFYWIVKNAPAFISERYTSSISNHLQKIKFQLEEQTEPLQPHKYIESWTQLTKKLLENEDFGKQFNADHGWTNTACKQILGQASSNMEKAKKLFSYVRDNFTCSQSGSIWVNNSLKDVYTSRNGTAAEINLLLLALLRRVNIEADPVLLSTRDHGRMYDQYPIYSQFNYIIDRITIDGKTYYLDATERGIGFGYLPLRCYNNHARVVNEAAETVQLNPGSILEKKTTDINLSLSKNGLNGTIRQVPGYYESHSIRRRSAEKGIEALAAEFKGDWGNDFVVSELRLDSLNNSEAPLAINYRFTLNQEDADILYIDPVFINAYKENPFKSSERLYPVEMPYALDDEYLLSFEIPEDYIVDELPRDLVVKLNVLEEGIFDYKVSRKGNNIQVRSHLVLKKAEFQSHEYNKLREFFGYIVKKQAEQIVLKKKK